MWSNKNLGLRHSAALASIARRACWLVLCLALPQTPRCFADDILQCGGAPGNDIRGVIVFKGPVSERPDRPRLKSVYYWSLRDGSIVQDKCYSENLQVIRSPLTQRRTTLSEWQSAATGAEVTDAAKVTFTIFNLELAFELPAGYKCLG